ncbi:hypothetical protein PIB30_074621 [Stylosanthes scabra]|uniref:DUF4283 domain-containing protein n=1 Tax=Stylosanthes scabra TaxID=79078 RepID=A0ABU6QPU9_9FABA|nr:hypothetical protein [Stylosanthes scabra]
MRWVEVRRATTKDIGFNGATVKDTGDNEAPAMRKERDHEGRKEVDVVWSIEHRDLLNRSLLGVSIKPIEFRKVMNFLLDEWKGPGEIECRDMRPYRCLITFSSMEIKDGAMEDELLNSVFDELRPHWEFCESLTRRVWIEIMGLPIGLWCTENLNRITKLWGRLIRQDDRIEEKKSFSTARVLLDSFQWEMIHEWISLKVDDKVFELFVKEFGSEVYSVQAHPDLMEEDFGSLLEGSGNRGSAMVVAPASSGASPVIFEKNSKKVNVGDPLIEVVINGRLDNMQELRLGEEYGGEDCGVSGLDFMSASKVDGHCSIKGVHSGLVGFDPVVHEAHIACRTKLNPFEYQTGPDRLMVLPNTLGNRNSSSTDDCPFPPAPPLQLVPFDPAVVGAWEATASSSRDVFASKRKKQGGDTEVGDEGESVESLYCINYDATRWGRTLVGETSEDTPAVESFAVKVSERSGSVL